MCTKRDAKRQADRRASSCDLLGASHSDEKQEQHDLNASYTIVRAHSAGLIDAFAGMYMVGRRKGRLCRRSWKRSPNGGRTKMVPYSSGTCSCRKKVGHRDKGSRTRKLKESRMRPTHATYQRTMIRREADRTAREQKQRAKKEQ